MIILIDGYNILKLVKETSRISETERSAFINLLGRYSIKRGHKIVVVFDAGPCVHPLKEKQRGVTLIYSGEHHTADDMIMKFVQDHPTKEIVVVTADREIISHVEGYNAQVVPPKVFYGKVKEAFNKSPEAVKRDLGNLIKTTEKDDADLDALMTQAARMKVPNKEDDAYEVPRHHQQKGKELSKKQRKRMKKIDKL